MAIPTEKQSQVLSNEIVIPEKLLQIVSGKPREINYLDCQMQKVPALLRLDKNNQQDYDPLAVSLGPYHHGKKELQLAEDFKLTALEMFVAGSGQNALFFYSHVLQHVNDARDCYLQGSTKDYDDPTFAQMMLLDACFIINLIARSKSGANFCITDQFLGDLVLSIILRDLFLLENQIPFWLLKLLMCLRYGKQVAEEMLNEFLNGTVFREYKGSGIASRDEELPLHLLDAFWLLLVSESPKDEPTTIKPKSRNLSACLNHFPNFRKCSNLHYCISKLPCFPRRRRNDDVNNNSTKKYVHWFCSATDLKAKGIQFQPSGADSLRSIKFKSGYFHARLELPIWRVSIYNTKVFFLNIIAHEMCPSTSTDQAVTSYIEFMKSLIDTPTDVKELRENGILLIALGSDEELVKVYKEINTYGVNNTSIFHNVKEEIQAHYNNKAKTWLAELFYTYFRSPWTAISLFAAVFLLVLTLLQTYYAVRPS